MLPLAAVLGGLLAFSLPSNVRLENLINLTFPSSLDERLVLVAIDDASLRDYGRLDVWPRALYAAALGTLHEAGVQAVGIDLLLSAPSADDATLRTAFERERVVLATSPDDILSPFPPTWNVIPGVSALNPPQGGKIRKVQTGYPTLASEELTPSFARQVAAQAAPPLPLNTKPRLLRYVSPQDIKDRTLSFRDVVNGNIRFSALQGKVAVIGLTAHGVNNALLDIDGLPTPGTILQLKAVSALLSPPLRTLPPWLVVLLCAAVATLAAWARGLWGYALALLALTISLPLWKLNIVFPGVSVSLSAILGTVLFVLEQWWSARRTSSRDPLTGFGNRLAFTRAVEQRWASRHTRPLGLVMLEVDHLRRVQQVSGRLAGEQVLRQVGTLLQAGRRRGDMVFRWSPEEFAILLDINSAAELEEVLRHYESLPFGTDSEGQATLVTVGGATTDDMMESPADLVEAASRHRYRVKYQRELNGTRLD